MEALKLFSQVAQPPAAPVSSWGWGGLAILIVIIAAVVALVWVAIREFGLAVPGWVIHVFWILAVAFVVILAIRLVMSM